MSPTDMSLARLASRQPICFWWGPDLLQFHNDDYLPMLADREDRALGAPFKELWSDVWEDVKPFVDQALSGKGTWAEDLPLAITRDGAAMQTFWTFSYSPLFDDNGDVSGLMNIVTETTAAVRSRIALDEGIKKANEALAAQRKAEQQHRLLQRELSHRLKNQLALVQAIVSQSLDRATDIASGARVTAERIVALGRSHDIIGDQGSDTADIRDVVDAGVKPHRDGQDRIEIAGPAVSLTSQQALGLSLAIHELSTNAVKYGALANDSGRICIDWSSPTDGSLIFRWSERNGPAVKKPARRGFGSRLATKVVPAYFDGKSTLDFRPEGLVFTLIGRIGSQSRDESGSN